MKTINLEFISIQKSKHSIARLILSRPSKANALNWEMICKLNEMLNKIKSTPDLRLVIIEAEGKHFCAGADLEYMRDSQKLSEEENQEQERKNPEKENLHPKKNLKRKKRNVKAIRNVIINILIT